MENETNLRGRILIVDDDKSILRTFTYCLENAGYAVTTAQNGEQARDQASTAAFDVCFLDLNLGEESGLDVLSQLREVAPRMRVVMATAQSEIDAAARAMHAGAVEYLVKPCSPEQLRKCAATQLQARRSDAAADPT